VGVGEAWLRRGRGLWAGGGYDKRPPGTAAVIIRRRCG